MKKGLTIILLIAFTTLISCKKEIKKENNKIVEASINNVISKINDPKSFELVKINIDTVYFFQEKIRLIEEDLTSIKKNLSPLNSKARIKRIKSLSKTDALKKFINKRDGTKTNEFLNKEKDSLTKVLKSLRDSISASGDNISYFKTETIFRNKNKFNAVVLDTIKNEIHNNI